MHVIISYLKQHKKTLFFALLLAAINQLFSLLDPQIFRILIDDYATRADELTRPEFINGVLLLLGGVVLVAFISRTAKAFQDYYVSVVTETVGTEMYADSVEHVFALPYGVFENERSGSILLNLQKARDTAKALIRASVDTVFISLVGIVFVVTYAFFVNWLIAVAFLAIIPIVGFSAFFLSRSIGAAQRQIVRESAELSGSTTETLRNVSLVKSLGLESQEVERLGDTNEKVLALELKKVVLLRKLSYIQGTLLNGLRAVLMFTMLYLIFTDAITLGEFMTLLFYSFFIFGPLTQVSDVVARYQEAQASATELERILSLKTEAGRNEGEDPGEIRSMRFENVSFAYDGSEQTAVQNVSFAAEAGDTIAFVGPSGSGKSTIIKLLVGLYAPQSGTYRINGNDSNNVRMNDFKKRIGLVSQSTELFAGTIRENLQFVAPDASDEKLIEALQQAHVEYILERGTPETGAGLDTKIGETGIKLSGGERQRLSIARALLRNPDVLIFDEATSSLDSITEQAITKTIDSIRKERPDMILILVAHRLSTIAAADTIFVLRGGAITEQGNRQSLLEQKGLFTLMWEEQMEAKSSQ